MAGMIKVDELHDLKYRAEPTYREAKGDDVLKEFDERVNKGMRYLASLRDRARSEDIPEDYIAAATAKLNDILKERLLFKRKYVFPLTVYTALYEIAKLTTDLGLKPNVEGERPVSAVQLVAGNIEVLVDLADPVIPF